MRLPNCVTVSPAAPGLFHTLVCACVCVCLCTFVRIYVSVSVCACVQSCIFMRVAVRTHVIVCLRTSLAALPHMSSMSRHASPLLMVVPLYIYIYVCVCMLQCIYVRIYVRTYICIYSIHNYRWPSLPICVCMNMSLYMYTHKHGANSTCNLRHTSYTYMTFSQDTSSKCRD